MPLGGINNVPRGGSKQAPAGAPPGFCRSRSRICGKTASHTRFAAGRFRLAWLPLLCGMVSLATGSRLAGQQKQSKPPTGRPPGQIPAAQHPPHPTPRTAPQISETIGSYQGQTVTVLDLAGQPGLNPAPLLARMPQKLGQPFSVARIQASIALLRHYYHDAQLDVRPQPNGLRVTLILQPADYFGVYEFPGATRFSYARLLEASNFVTQEPYSTYDIAQARKNLITFFQREGYFLAKIAPQIEVERENHLVNVNFRVTLGRKAKFGKLVFNGVTPRLAAHFRSSLHSIMARLRGAAIFTGSTYSLSTLRKATSRLQGEMDGHHHLAGQVRLESARYDPRTNRAAVIFNVNPGPRLTLSTSGVFLWPWTRHSLIPIYAEHRVSPTLVREGQNDLVSHLSKSGYFDAQVITTVEANGQKQVMSARASAPLQPPLARAAAQPAAQIPPPPLPPRMSLRTHIAAPPAAAAPAPRTAVERETIHYQIEKGPRHSLLKVGFAGNYAFSARRLMRHVRITPKSWWFFSHGSYSQRRLRRSVSALKNYYHAWGYNHVSITSAVNRPGGNVEVLFRIHEGAQDHVATLRLEGDKHLPEQVLAPQGFQLAPGRPFTQARLKKDENAILAKYLSFGYLNATVRARALQAPHHPQRVNVMYRIHEGPQVRIATIVTDGREHASQRYINLLTKELRAEDFLSTSNMMTAETKLYQPGVFNWADVGTLRPVTTQPLEDVVVRVHESPRNELTYGFGFDLTNRGGSIPSGTVALPGLPPVGLPSKFKTSQATFWGPSGNIEYTRLDLGGKAESFSAGLFAGRLLQRLNLAYTDPNFRWSKWSSNLLATGEIDEQNPIFSSRLADIAYQLQRPLNYSRTEHLFLRYDFNETGLTRLLIPGLIPVRDRHVRLSTVSATFIRDTRDNPLDAHRGVYETAELDASPGFLGSSADFMRFLGQAAAYRRVFGTRIIWANSLRIGLDHAFSGSFVPISQAFFSGGGSTLRGFSLDGAGPQKTIPACGNPNNKATCTFINVPVGGDELAIVNSEFRIPTPFIYPNLGVALFYDGGNVFQHIGFSHLGANWSNSIGFGLRYSTPVGPIRLDIGHNLNPPTGISSTQIFITFGQAF